MTPAPWRRFVKRSFQLREAARRRPAGTHRQGHQHHRRHRKDRREQQTEAELAHNLITSLATPPAPAGVKAMLYGFIKPELVFRQATENSRKRLEIPATPSVGG